MSKRANERFTQKNERFAHTLIYHEHPERIAHSHSFVMSNLSNLLKVTLLSWATWAICLQHLICPEWSEQIAHDHSLKWAILSKWANEWMSEWGNSQPWFDQDREFALSLFLYSLFCSKWFPLKSDCERFTLVAFKKRAIVSKPHLPLFTKEWWEQIAL